ncbi:MAG: endonuclease III [Clostridia bacterium]|nr:endonuclease III [Clostridia bacterium]
MEHTNTILDILAKLYPDAKSELHFDSHYQLLVAVILSAQCTDKRVNEITRTLFTLAGTPQQMEELPIERLEEIIYSCGFYHNKAKYIKQCTHDIMDKYNGQVPNNLLQLQQLAGVGRKTANVVYAVAFGGQAIAVDTHVYRVSNRLGLTNANNVLDTEKQLMSVIAREMWSQAHHYILLHGRYVCASRRPRCNQCPLTLYCKYYAQNTGQVDNNKVE